MVDRTLLPLLKGFMIDQKIADYKDNFIPIKDSKGVDNARFKELSFNYFEKMVSLCKEKGIQLLLVKTPIHTFTQAQHNAVEQYSENNDIPFIDFNTEELYEEIGFQYGSADMNDIGKSSGHANPSGARKMSTYLANLIVENDWATGVKDEQWEVSKEFNDGLYKDFVLHNETDLETYLGMLEDDRYTVMLSAKEGIGTELSEECVGKLKGLGLSSDWNMIQKKGYLGMIEKGKIRLDEATNEEYRGSFRNGVMRLVMSSGNKASIKINEKEQSKNLRGLNIVVYNNDRKCVIDSVNFDTFEEQCSCHR